VTSDFLLVAPRLLFLHMRSEICLKIALKLDNDEGSW